jgi:outer membrane protein assembly factor BamB
MEARVWVECEPTRDIGRLAEARLSASDDSMGELRTGRAVPSTGFVVLVGAAALCGTPDCEQPTEVTLSITTTVPCARFSGVTITVGPASEVETMAPGTEAQTCTGSGVVGTIVVVPGGAKDEGVDIKVVGGVNRDPATCTAPAYGNGCIVARRSLQFIPHTPLVLDIALTRDCNGVVCSPDQTCVQGACTSSQVQNPSACTTPGTCGQGSLEPTNAPPEPPSPLVCGDTAGLQSAAAWPMLGYCPTHIGRGPNTSAKTNHVRWTATAGGEVSGGIAIAADGTIYAGASDGKLYAFAPSGETKWSAAVGTSSFTNAVPAIAGDGSIYLGNQDENLYSVTSAGVLVWKYKIGGHLFTSASVGPDGTIYMGGSGGEHAAFALAHDGTLDWMFATGDDVDSSPAIDFEGNVYFGSEDSNLYAVGANGAKEWAFADTEGGAQTPVIGMDGSVYFNGKASICSLDAQGKLTWVTPMSNEASIPAIGWDGTVYSASADGGFYAFDGARGTIKWHLTSLGDFDTGNQPTIGGDGTIYIGTTTGVFYAFTPAGSVLWKLTTGGAIHGPAAIATDGTLYFGSGDEKLYAVGP